VKWWFRVAVAACVFAGVALRVRGFLFGTIPVWLDEATWADLLMRKSVWLPSIRPLGFMVATKGLVWCFGEREAVLRLLPWLAGIGSTLLSVPLARRLLTHRAAQLLFIAAIAFQPSAIDYSKEFKPYSISLFLHLACLFLALRYFDERKLSQLLSVVGCAFAGLFFSQDVLFALPALYLTVGFVAWRGGLRTHVLTALGCALATLGVLLLFYFFAWRTVSNPSVDDAYWGNKYDVFFVHGHGQRHWLWSLEKYGDIAAYPGQRRESWRATGPLGAGAVATLSSLYRAFWIMLHFAGIALLAYRRRFLELTLLLGPLLTLLAFNALGLWPFGAFRTNLFAVGYASALAACALDGWLATEALELAPALVAVVLPLCLFERDWHEDKHWAGGETAFSDLTRTLMHLQGHHAHKEPLVLDWYACRVFHYYLVRHPDYKKVERELDKRFTTQCNRSADALGAAQETASDHRVWLVLASPQAELRAAEERDQISNLINLRAMPNLGGVVVELGPQKAL
jgi:hypothetical protein